LQRDFIEELPGYEHNEGIRQALAGLDLKPADSVEVMVERCYETLIRRGWVGAGEELLLRAWLDDLRGLGVGM
jgi:hypothetical protein